MRTNFVASWNFDIYVTYSTRRNERGKTYVSDFMIIKQIDYVMYFFINLSRQKELVLCRNESGHRQRLGFLRFQFTSLFKENDQAKSN